MVDELRRFRLQVYRGQIGICTRLPADFFKFRRQYPFDWQACSSLQIGFWLQFSTG